VPTVTIVAKHPRALGQLLDLAGQDPFAQQIELRATEPLSFDHLDPVDVAFDLPGAVVQTQPVGDRV
jgi:hypothetical protein